MGRKEKRKQAKLLQSFKEKQSDRDYFKEEIYKMRSELSVRFTKLQEVLVRITQEFGAMKTHLTLLDKTFLEEGILKVEQLQATANRLGEETKKMFDKNGRMKGEPIVTLYNCDFDVTCEGHEVRRVDTL